MVYVNQLIYTKVQWKMHLVIQGSKLLHLPLENQQLLIGPNVYMY